VSFLIIVYIYCTPETFTALDYNERAPASDMAINQAVNSGGLEYK